MFFLKQFEVITKNKSARRFDRTSVIVKFKSEDENFSLV